MSDSDAKLWAGKRVGSEVQPKTAESMGFFEYFGRTASVELAGNPALNGLATLLSALPDVERREALATLSPQDLAALEYSWELWARRDQLPPPGPWRTWLLLGGRGSGKTRSSAEATRAEVESGRRRSIGLISPTADTARRDMIATLLQVSPPWNMPQHEPSQRRIIWPNGATAYVLSSEEPDRIRGLNLDWAWGDELTSWNNQADVWSNLQLALRVNGPTGASPAAIISTTPKRQPLLRTIMAAPSTVVTRSRTLDNALNLAADTIDYLQKTYGGTTLGRQELDAEILNDVDGALWRRELIDSSRAQTAPADLKRVVVGVDPSGSSTGAECGIVVAGIGKDDSHGYVLSDQSGKYTPDGWARAAVGAYHWHRADRIVAEVNYGGRMVEATIRSVDPNVPVKLVTASRGKAVRAEPIVALYEQKRVHHVGILTELEDQMCSWVPDEGGPSPDRVDALVWAMTELLSEKQPQPARYIYFDWIGR